MTPKQIRALSAREAAEGRPVRLVGTVLSKQIPSGTGMFVAREGQAVWVRSGAEGASHVRVGDEVEIRGIVDPGGFSNSVVARVIRVLGAGRFPEPTVVRLEEFPDMRREAKWVEVAGTVRGCRPMSWRDVSNGGEEVDAFPDPAALAAFSVVELSNGNTRLTVKVDAPLDPERYVDAEVVVRGVCVNQHNLTRQFVRQFLVAPGESFVTVTKPTPECPFSLPVVPLASLYEYSEAHSTRHRVRIHGVVTRGGAIDAAWIRDGERGMLVTGFFPGNLVPGDVVDVVGFPSLRDFSPTLENARLRVLRREPPPQAIPLESRETAARVQGNLVSLVARVVGQRPSTDGRILSLDWDGTPIEAVLEGPAGAPDRLPGATIRATGILALSPHATPTVSGVWHPREFQLLLRSAADIATLKPAPWWTVERVSVLLAAIAAGSLLTVAGVALFSRKRLREQALQRRMAEAEFSAVLNERNRLAREIHDTLAQGLNAVSMQLELARGAHRESPERTGRHIASALQIVRSGLAEARSSIWNMRSQALEKADLPGALERVTGHLVAGLEIEARVHTSGRARRLPPVVENNLLRIGQESVANAVKHSGASRIDVALDYDGGRVRLRVADDGVGFQPGSPPGERSGFGVLGIRERVAEMHGELRIGSEGGRGTTVAVEVEVPV